MDTYYEDFFQNESHKQKPSVAAQKKHSGSSGSSQGKVGFSKPTYSSNYQKGSSSDQGGTRIYVSNMKPGTDEKMLRKLFEEFGEIKDVNHRGTFAFVEFFEAEHAQRAIKEMSEKSEMRV